MQRFVVVEVVDLGPWSFRPGEVVAIPDRDLVARVVGRCAGKLLLRMRTGREVLIAGRA